MLLRAADFGLSGYETKETLDNNASLKTQLENIRLQAGELMNLGNVEQQSIPKMCLLSPPQYAGRLVNTRMFIPHVCHDAIGVLAAVSVATACLISNSIAKNIAVLTIDNKDINQGFSVEHPSGEFAVNLEFRYDNGRLIVEKSGVIRTARLLSRGDVFVPIDFKKHKKHESFRIF